MSWLSRLFLRRKQDAQLDSELRFHIEQQTADNIAAGMDPAEARRRALAQFGGLEYIKEETREARGTQFLESLLQDLRFGLRMLRKSPGFTAVAVLTLALGIGANTAVFSVMNTVMLRPLPYQHPENLVTTWPVHKSDPNALEDLTPIADVASWEKQNHVFTDVAAIGGVIPATLAGMGEPEQVAAQSATTNFFALAGVQPALGRVFRADESPNNAQTVVISDAFWKRKFGGDPGALGKTFRINGLASTVVGVMPPGFIGVAPWYEGKEADVWEPVNLQSAKYANRSVPFMMPLARLKEGVTLAQAQSEMDIFARQLEQAYPETNRGVAEKVIPLYGTIYRESESQLYPLLGAVGFVLLIACLNAASLMLSWTEGRRKEYSVRAALGSSRGRLLRQLLAESGLLTLIGASLGVLFAFLGTDLLRVMATGLPDAESIRIGGRVLLFAAGLSVLTVILFGLAPAIRASNPDLMDALRDLEGRTATPRRGRSRYLLVISEVALALVLLVGAGLMFKSLLRVWFSPLGFDPKNLLTMSVEFPEYGGKYLTKIPGKATQAVSPMVVAYHQQLIDSVATMPGVESVGMISIIPPMGAGMKTFSIVGRPAPSPEDRPMGYFNEVSPGYFHTMRIPLRKGRYLQQTDTASAPWVAVISETLANRYFPNGDAVGQRILMRFEPSQVDEEQPREIVGVVGEAKQIGVGGVHPLIYESFLQQPEAFPRGGDYFHLSGTLVIRTFTDVHVHERDIITEVRRMVKQMDPDLPVTSIKTMENVLRKFTMGFKAYVLMLGIFAGIAVLLAAIGTYAVLSYFVSQHTREMGIRVALGAQRGQLFAWVAKLGLTLAGAGLAIGVALALALNQFMREHFWLFGVTVTDPTTYSAIVILMVAVALLACYIPARRAMRVDPMVALRYE